jgi:hypothetical protein
MDVGGMETSPKQMGGAFRKKRHRAMAVPYNVRIAGSNHGLEIKSTAGIMSMKTEHSGRGKFVVPALLVAFSLYYTQPALAISGNRWLKLKTDERVAYISGVLDTWDDDVALCEKKPEEPWCAYVKLAYEPIILCSQHRTYSEIFAVVQKYMKEHPEEWERSMTGHIWIALYESCQKNKP